LSKNQAYFGYLTNPITQAIALESCSNLQKTWQAFKSAMKKKFGFSFFVSKVMSKVDFWPFWLMLPGLGPNQ